METLAQLMAAKLPILKNGFYYSFQNTFLTISVSKTFKRMNPELNLIDSLRTIEGYPQSFLFSMYSDIPSLHNQILKKAWEYNPFKNYPKENK